MKNSTRSKGKGNKKKQLQRRRERKKDLPKYRPENFQLIDNNWTHYPVAYCSHYGGYLSVGLISTHRCDKRDCPHFHMGVEVNGD